MRNPFLSLLQIPKLKNDLATTPVLRTKVHPVPFHSKIDHERKLIVTVGTGSVSVDEILEYHIQLRRDPTFDPKFNQLIDLTKVSRFPLSAADIQRIAQDRFLGPSSRRAFVAQSTHIFGLLRMFETYRELYGFEEQIQVFEKIELAMEWLSAGEADRMGS
jgi:hypothetical protein